MLQHRKASVVTLFPLSINSLSHLSKVVLKVHPFLEDELNLALGKLVIQKMIHKEAHLFRTTWLPLCQPKPNPGLLILKNQVQMSRSIVLEGEETLFQLLMGINMGELKYK